MSVRRALRWPAPKLHLIYRLHITPEVGATLAETELDEEPDAGHETGIIEWINYRETAEVPIRPPIGAAPGALPPPSPTTPAPGPESPYLESRNGGLHREA